MTHDPYAAPAVAPDDLERPAPLRDLRWRGAMWFAVPLLALVVVVDVLGNVDFGTLRIQLLRELFETTLMLALPGAAAGYASGRRCRSTSWPRFVALAVRDGAVWAIYLLAMVWLYTDFPNPWHVAWMAKLLAFVAALTISLTLLLAVSLRSYYRDRP